MGIDALPVEVEVDVSPGALPKTVLVGLPDAAVKGSTHRVERAIVNSGFIRPQDRIVINLAPAELPKQAASFDLPITLGMLAGSGQLESELFERYAVVGELSLEGMTRPVKGALSMSMSAASQQGLLGIVVPAESAAEAAVVEDLEVIPVASLAQAVGFFSGALEIEPTPSRLEELFQAYSKYDDDCVLSATMQNLKFTTRGGCSLLEVPIGGRFEVGDRRLSTLPCVKLRTGEVARLA